ncbi:hypothetical protein BN931_79 [Bifidobacterium animalis subsp. lactis CECT 8145]|nr:hypothetical protein M8PIadj_1508 [Bifidobacterium animalis]CDL70899.1 hypothetical protein BN931_79 [Bifidobacterium animalis subsp. lactis CECT 8145]
MAGAIRSVHIVLAVGRKYSYMWAYCEGQNEQTKCEVLTNYRHLA